MQGHDVFAERIQPGMQRIVQWSLESAQDSVVHRERSFELFGYDFMVDEECNPWLIEVNTSPAMDYSTVKFGNRVARYGKIGKECE